MNFYTPQLIGNELFNAYFKKQCNAIHCVWHEDCNTLIEVCPPGVIQQQTNTKMKTIPQLKKSLLMIAAGSVAVFSQAANAITITLDPTSIYYIGNVTPGLPADQTTQVEFLTALKGLALNASSSTLVPGETDVITRSSNVLALTEVPTEAGQTRFLDPFPNSYSITGAYVALKYGGGGQGGFQRMEFYYTSGLTGSFTVGSTTALSSVTTYNPGPGDGPGRKVPDGGTTVAALGFALLGLGSMRKLIGSKA
jgi:VPDSG-CTERM motif